jgi:hypothetical protein
LNALDFASAPSSFNGARALIQQVDEARRTIALHCPSRVRHLWTLLGIWRGPSTNHPTSAAANVPTSIEALALRATGIARVDEVQGSLHKRSLQR